MNTAKKESKLLNALVYFIVIITVAMISPLIYKFADDYSNSMISNQGKKEIVNDKGAKNKNYSVSENIIDISGLKNTEFGELDLVTAKVMDGGNILLFCSSRVEIIPPAPETTESVENTENTESAEETEITTEYIPPPAETEYETLLRIAEINTDGNIAVSNRAFKYNFLESINEGDYIFRDFSDGTFFLSNNKSAFLFNLNSMRIAYNFTYPKNYNIYHTALSNNKEMLALATEQGFFVANLDVYMSVSSSNMKEIIAPVNVNGVALSARYPVWSYNDESIYYKLYADNFIRNAGLTTPSPGGNEQLTALNCNNFVFLNTQSNDSVFYYFFPGTEANPENSFRCGYFNPNDKKMTEVMKSQVYYFDIDVSSKGNHLAALSNNGTMIKISVIDIRTKKLIYSSLYNEIHDFSFSPDEKNIIIYGRTENKTTLKVINIDWAEE